MTGKFGSFVSTYRPIEERSELPIFPGCGMVLADQKTASGERIVSEEWFTEFNPARIYGHIVKTVDDAGVERVYRDGVDVTERAK